MAYIQTIPFDSQTPYKLGVLPYGCNWPVVYILNNDKEAYVGETLDAVTRSSQHLDNPERQKLTQMSIITDDTFNKSVILDLEAYLIKHMSADNRFQLQNGNDGLQNHNYFNRNIYEKRFEDIWNQLREKKIANRTAHDIENSNLFKYSPYNALSSDQYLTVTSIIHELSQAYKKGKGLHSLVCGGPGTGKTILGVYLMKLLHDRNVKEVMDLQDEDVNSRLMKDLLDLPDLKIGFVVPMGSLRSTMENIFSSVHGLRKSMIIGPTDVTKKPYDLLIVDEAHRLKRREGLSQYGLMDKNNNKLGLDKDGTELDWILKSSKYQIFFYDDKQTVRPCDVLPSQFAKITADKDSRVFRLRTQFRCKGGDDYIRYIRDIFSSNPPPERKSFDGYDLKIFDDVSDMVESIRDKNDDVGLCRNLAGYAWKWISKDDQNAYDITIGQYKYRWNTVNHDWVNSPDAIDEIGCIHTIQGYDLNYAGVILGPEIDFIDGKFVIDPSKYADPHGKDNIKSNQEKLVEYICNIYTTMLTRGICGTYIYACNAGLRNYLKHFVKVQPHYEIHVFEPQNELQMSIPDEYLKIAEKSELE